MGRRRQQQEGEGTKWEGRKQKRKLFSSKSSLSLVALTVVFSALIGMMIIPSAVVPVVFVLADSIQGTPGDDTLNGTPKADTINGFEGNDLIYGKAGDDTLDGGTGDDVIYGGPGNDEIKDVNDEIINYGSKVYGGAGNDNIDLGIDYTLVDFYYVYGEAGADDINVVSNADIHGGPKGDTIYCTGYQCIAYGDEGNDNIHIEAYDIENGASGGSGNDKLYFKGGGGFLYGDDGNDYLLIESGSADIHGDKGDDTLEGSDGYSFYFGGPGADNFKCSPGPYDVVEDYNPQEGDTVSANCETV
jgi:Ca2+-binding RTX toxin-like protein